MEGNNRIRVTYDPYRKLIQCEYQREGGNTWEFPSAGGKLAAVFQQGTLKGSLQNSAHSIVRGITDDYCMHGQGVDLLFRGTEEDWEYLQMVVKETADTKIVCRGKAGQLSSAGEVLPKIKNIFQKLSENVDDSTGSEVKKPICQYLDAVEPDVVLYVTGTYSAGKSTFINALIGEELLPSAVDPTTAHIFKIVVKGKGDWVDTEVCFQYLGKKVALKFRSDGYVLEDLNQWPDLELKHCLDQDLRDTTPGPAYICKVLSVLNNFNKLKNPNPEDGQKAPHTAYISTQIEVHTPFYHSSLPLEKFHFLIFDTPGTNAKNHKDHLATMKESLERQTNGLPIFLVPSTQMDSNDAGDLRRDIHEIGDALDESNILIVVTQADTQEIEDLEKQADGSGKRAASDCAENRICYTSSIVGLGAKKGEDSQWGNKSTQKKFNKAREDYTDGSIRLYQIDSLPPDQKSVIVQAGDLANSSGNEQEKLFHNSGLWAVEREIEWFAEKFADYNKCWQAHGYLSDAIEMLKKLQEEKHEEQNKLKKDSEEKFQAEKGSLLAAIDTESNEWKSKNFEKCKNEQKKIVDSYTPQEEALAKEVETQWKQEKADHKGGLGKNALEPFRSWAKGEMYKRTTAIKERVEEFANKFWIQKIDEYKGSCIKIVKGSATLTEDEKTIIESYIIKIRPPKFEPVYFSLNRDVAGEKSFFIVSWAYVNPKRCASEMRGAILSTLTAFTENYSDSLVEDIAAWVNRFEEGLKQELAALNPMLAELNLEIQAYTDQIEKLERTHERLEEAQKELNSYFTLKEDGGAK